MNETILFYTYIIYGEWEEEKKAEKLLNSSYLFDLKPPSYTVLVCLNETEWFSCDLSMSIAIFQLTLAEQYSRKLSPLFSLSSSSVCFFLNKRERVIFFLLFFGFTLVQRFLLYYKRKLIFIRMKYLFQ